MLLPIGPHHVYRTGCLYVEPRGHIPPDSQGWYSSGLHSTVLVAFVMLDYQKVSPGHWWGLNLSLRIPASPPSHTVYLPAWSHNIVDMG